MASIVEIELLPSPCTGTLSNDDGSKNVTQKKEFALF